MTKQPELILENNLVDQLVGLGYSPVSLTYIYALTYLALIYALVCVFCYVCHILPSSLNVCAPSTSFRLQDQLDRRRRKRRQSG